MRYKWAWWQPQTHTHHSYILWQDFIHIMGRYYSKFNINTVITTFRAGKYLSLLWHDTKGTCISWRWISVGMIQLELYCHLDVIKINQLLVCMRWTQLCILQNVCQVPYNSLWLKTLPSITILSHYKWHTTLQLQYLSEMKEQMSSSRIYWTAAHQYIYAYRPTHILSPAYVVATFHQICVDYSVKRADFQGSPISGILRYLCLHPLMQNDKIQHANTYGEGCILGQPCHCICTNALCSLLTTAEFLIPMDI